MIRVQIETWAAGGRGLGRVDGRVFMVDGAVPGDRVLARVVKDRGRYVEATTVAVEQPAGSRRAAPCVIQHVCGGCPLMVVDEADQRTAKRRFLVDALRRIGRFPEDLPVGEVVDSGIAFGYRAKIELAFGREAGSRPVIGYHRMGRPSELVDVPECIIAEPRLTPLLTCARDFFLDGPATTDLAALDAREPLRLVLRSSGARDERLIALRGLPGPIPTLPEFARAASVVDPGLVGVVRLHAAAGRRGGARVETIAGRAWIEDEVHGTSFRVPAATFLQVHRAAAEGLGEHVLAGAEGAHDVLELYGGIGALSLALARRGTRTTVVDADPEAVACGAEAARTHGRNDAVFLRADVLEYLGRTRSGVPDLVIADPPRTGLGRGVAARLSRLAAPRIALVSCDPATLARDLAALVAGGYGVTRVTPFDLFPQTAHIEAVAWLSYGGA